MNTNAAIQSTHPWKSTLRAVQQQRDSLWDEFDKMVRNASRGDARAVGAIAIALGPALLDLARSVLGEPDAGHILNEYFTSLVECRAGRFCPGRERGIRWLGRGIIRVARRARREND